MKFVNRRSINKRFTWSFVAGLQIFQIIGITNVTKFIQS